MIPKQKDYLHYLEQLKITRMLLISNLPASGIHGQKTQLLKWILTSITALRSTNAWYTPSIPKITFWWCGPSTNPISGVGGADSTLSKFICLILKNAQNGQATRDPISDIHPMSHEQIHDLLMNAENSEKYARMNEVGLWSEYQSALKYERKYGESAKWYKRAKLFKQIQRYFV